MIPARAPTDHPARWQTELAGAITAPEALLAAVGLPVPEGAALARMQQAAARFGLRVPQAYVALMERGNPADPLLRQVLAFRSDAPDALEARMQAHSAHGSPHPTSRDDVCLIAFTSGTTGKPKGTMHFHRDVLAMCDLFPRHVLHMDANDVVCGTPPVAFTFGLGGLLAFPLRYGASTVLLERHTPESLLQTIAKYRATQCYTAPTMYRQMAALAGEHDLSSLKHLHIPLVVLITPLFWPPVACVASF